eukprot:CAMPEP_0114579812 /NCGR_PEP_ID=MMETSP0125-20121206/4168_1 /TAXON_ID=485358 ORGANISM="Aristerostoma sp., Strain ATCC 50986" /NCGR_SAMPLE_ID=MMETSP0125 /ASSEMBLY_ACC=CAM_ASM_000245 /LENGTH=81 /DNA_ID=CAMNT_0001770889 /DNA_START=981 /DNA_END=1223 /DNA_ORIENTATION=+
MNPGMGVGHTDFDSNLKRVGRARFDMPDRGPNTAFVAVSREASGGSYIENYGMGDSGCMGIGKGVLGVGFEPAGAMCKAKW